MSRPTELQENVYLLSDWKPGKEDSDEKGNVLFFKPGFGWYSGFWQRPHMEGTTHWTYLPLKPPAAEDAEQVRERQFNEWINSFPANSKFDELALSLLRLGWNAGWNRAH